MVLRKCDGLRLAALALALAVGRAEGRLVSGPARLNAIARAKVWREVDVAAMDVLNGPVGEGSYKLGAEVRCRFEERDPLKPIGGHTKKFPCVDAAGKRLKVKYDPKANTEVFGEVAGSRLFWALGFFAERMYSVKIACENCPEDPFVSDKSPRALRAFEPATLQRKLEGVELSEVDGEGWEFHELDLVDEKRGGSSRAEVDALKLLAAFVNHGDNTPNQQRLLCPEGDAECKTPWMYVTDLGAVFGGTSYLPSFRNWSKKAVWKDSKRCIADYSPTVKKSRDPRIGEAGRKLLAGQLAKLSDQQIRDLFRGARFDVLGGLESPIRVDGKSRRAGVDDWARAFKKKRAEIVDARCPE